MLGGLHAEGDAELFNLRFQLGILGLKLGLGGVFGLLGGSGLFGLGSFGGGVHDGTVLTLEPRTVKELAEGGAGKHLTNGFTLDGGVLGHGDGQREQVVNIGRHSAGVEQGNVLLKIIFRGSLALDNLDEVKIGVEGGVLPSGLGVAIGAGGGLLGVGRHDESVGIHGGGGHSDTPFVWLCHV